MLLKSKEDTPKPNVGGRPRALEIGDPDVHRQIHELAGIFCTKAEAAGVLGVSIRTLERYLAVDDVARNEWEQGQYSGKASLRRMQFKLAERNAGMAIFLGKQFLGQRDVTEGRIYLKRLVDMTEEELTEFLEGTDPEEMEAAMAGPGNGKPKDDATH